MSPDSSAETVSRPYNVTVTAAFDGNDSPYFLYFDDQQKPMRSPLIIPKATPAYDGICFTQTGDATPLRLWAAATHTLDGGTHPQGGNLLLAVDGTVAIKVKPKTTRGTVLIFELLNDARQVVGLVPTPDPRTKNEG